MEHARAAAETRLVAGQRVCSLGGVGPLTHRGPAVWAALWALWPCLCPSAEADDAGMSTAAAETGPPRAVPVGKSRGSPKSPAHPASAADSSDAARGPAQHRGERPARGRHKKTAYDRLIDAMHEPAPDDMC